MWIDNLSSPQSRRAEQGFSFLQTEHVSCQQVHWYPNFPPCFSAHSWQIGSFPVVSVLVIIYSPVPHPHRHHKQPRHRLGTLRLSMCHLEAAANRRCNSPNAGDKSAHRVMVKVSAWAYWLSFAHLPFCLLYSLSRKLLDDIRPVS